MQLLLALPLKVPSVVLADINESGAQEAAAIIGDMALAVYVDVADASSCEAMVAQTIAAWRIVPDLSIQR